ncbi:Uncharacterised protein [Edwardsiella tarda]|nr:Uncharacterised protein [Edwardsiella tarda]
MAKGRSISPTTGTIQAGVACAVCWRCESQRVTLYQANSTMPLAPMTHSILANTRL